MEEHMETNEGHAAGSVQDTVTTLLENPHVVDALKQEGLQIDHDAINVALNAEEFVNASLLKPFTGLVPRVEAFCDTPQQELQGSDDACTQAHFALGAVTRQEFEELRDAVATLARGLSAILEDFKIIDELEARIELFNKNSAHKL
jgi:hypothetical protein